MNIINGARDEKVKTGEKVLLDSFYFKSFKQRLKISLKPLAVQCTALCTDNE